MLDPPVPPVPALLLELARRRWNVPVLARLHPDRRMSFGALAASLHASREGVSGALTNLQAPGWVRREPGRRGLYGLTTAGRIVAAPCGTVVAAAQDLAVDDLAFRRWTLPIVAALRGWELRFAELRVLLPGISPRALTLALKDMQAQRLVDRRVLGGFPPATAYRLTKSATLLRTPVERLAAVTPGPPSG